ncbi:MULTISPECIES: hydroxyisourate hydrolase [unclassified Nocardioides]|jgi:5-hydroxyisourate hydrolase|uniref:hydroxyisourate hydrolase n=1 Tax=Nocardioides sp. URHA0032 TaxID=1380388 RepID=UPI00048B5E23|nr:hydroxyisourate hydrolase [Nocardioides sp. URHA0032]
MASLSTHVLDTSRGRPAAGVAVRLESGGAFLGAGVTDGDGRVASLAADLPPGDYTLVFDTGSYLGADAFYPEVAVAFRVGGDEHYHVPLLLNPFGYSTYRGS